MSNNNKNDKLKMEKCRQEYARRYNNEINELKNRIKELEEDKENNLKIIDEQSKKLEEQEEQLSLYRMVVGMHEDEIVKLIETANTKTEFLEAMHSFSKILNLY